VSARAAARLAQALAVLCAAAVLAAAVLLVLVRRSGFDVEAQPLGVGAALFGFPLVGALAATRRPANPVGWIMLWVGLEASLWTLSFFYGAYGVEVGRLPATKAAEWWAAVNWPAGSALVGIVLLALLFPAGHASSPRWRPAVGAVVLVTVLVTVHDFLAPGTLTLSYASFENPLGTMAVQPLAASGGLIALTSAAVALAAAGSLIARVRRASGDERAQLTWFVAALTLAGGVAAVLWIVWLAGDFHDAAWPAAAGLVGLGGVPLAIGVAILRFRLYEIDALLRRSLVYAVVTVLLLGAYVGLLLAIGPLPGTGQGFAVAIVAAVPVALLFGPLRRHLQRSVNRRLYGDDEDPHAAVRELGRGLAGSLAPVTALPTVIETVTRTLRVPYAAILLERDGVLEPAASTGTPPEERLSLALAYAGARVGSLEIGLREGDELSSVDRMLLGGLARQAGVAAHAVLLAADLQRSRERLVSAREEERRRLRRDLHDGLGPTLAGMVMQLGAADHLIAHGLPGADEALVEVKSAARAAVDDIRRLVYELRPPALDELGLVGALERQADAFSPLDVRVESPAPVGGLPAAVEVAAYRIAVEAMTNVARHAHARHCRVRLALDEMLVVEISDDGEGNATDFRANVGLESMRERAAELGGTCTIERGPSGGTRVHARIPMPEE
jgi:two-component system, NarL family, sensor kinase